LWKLARGNRDEQKAQGEQKEKESKQEEIIGETGLKLLEQQ
jgi:hypothetical protein